LGKPRQQVHDTGGGIGKPPYARLRVEVDVQGDFRDTDADSLSYGGASFPVPLLVVRAMTPECEPFVDPCK
jgi:hypothetical protein